MTAEAGDLLANLGAGAAGRRLLAVLNDPSAEVRREGRRGPRLAGAIEGVAVTGDALADLVDGRTPDQIDLTWPGEPATLADELRRRLRGDVIRRAWHDVVELRCDTSPPLVVRVVAGGAGAGDPWSDPVLTARAGRLGLDGRLDDPAGDLARRHVRLTDAEAFRRCPEAVLHLARLASRPRWTIEPATLVTARDARRSGAPATAPVVRLGVALSALLASREAIAALGLLRDLAPDVPLADGVEVDEARLRTAFDAPPSGRLDAVLRALAPTASTRRLHDFRAGARLRDLRG